MNVKSIFTAICTIPLFIQLCAADVQPAFDKTKFWYKSPRITLYNRHSRGASFNSAMRRAQYKVQNPRPAKSAEFVYKAKLDRNGTLDYAKIPLELLEEYGVDRKVQIRVGFPLPQGAVFKPEQIRLLDSTGKERVVQTAITAFWQDKSIKWALLQFSAELKANEKSSWFVECGYKVKRANTANIAVTQNKDAVIINTGKLKAVISKNKFNIIRSLTLNGKAIGGFSPAGVVLKDALSGKEFTTSALKPKSVVISEYGPAKVTVKVSGQYANGNRTTMDYIARISFYAGFDGFDLEFTHINTDIRHEFTDFLNMDVQFLPAGGIKSLTAGNNADKSAAQRIFQETDQYFSVDNGKRIAGQISGTVKLLGNDNNFWSISIADAWQRYPKGFSWDNKMLKLELLPVQPDKEFNRDLPFYLSFPFCEGTYRMKWGMAFTEHMRFEFQGSSANMKKAEADISLPVIAVLPKSWYAKTETLPGTGINGFEEIDKKITASFEMRLKQMHSQREYGFFNFGDSFGEKGENWTNNEYDMANGLFMLFVRTGNRKVFRHALRTARHQANTDTCHAYPDPYYVGANHMHRAGHTGDYKYWTSHFNYYQTAANGHTWNNGMINAWQLYGDAFVMDTIWKHGDHIALAMAPSFYMRPEHPQAPREAAWALRALVAVYKLTGDPVYLKAMTKLKQEMLKYAAIAPAGNWYFIHTRLVKVRNDRTPCFTSFINSVGLKGLCEYYSVTKDKSVLPLIKSVAEQIASGFSKKDGCGFAYDISHTGKHLNFILTTMNSTISPALAEAAVILKDKKLFAAAEASMNATFLRSPGITGKYLAEYQVFLSEYLQSLKNFYGKTDYDFSEKNLLSRSLHDYSTWHWRSPRNGKFLVRLKSASPRISMRRWLWPAPQKPKFNSFIKIMKDGKIINEHTFDTTKLETYTVDFTLPGKPGDEFTVIVNDHGNADWEIIPTSDFVHAGFSENRPFIAARNGFNRFYFAVEPGAKVRVQYNGTHIGGFGFWCMDEQNKIIHTETGWTEKHSLNVTPSKVITLHLKGGKERKIYSIVTWAEMDGRFRLDGTKYFSGTAEFFKTK